MNTKRLLENWREDYALCSYLLSLDIDILRDDLTEFVGRLSAFRFRIWCITRGYHQDIQKLIDLNEQDYKFFDYLWNQDFDIDRKKLSDWEGRLLESGEILDKELAKCELTVFDEFKVKTNG